MNSSSARVAGVREPDQSPGVPCRNMRRRGYHGLSSPSVNQYHSKALPPRGNNIQTGISIAPAKWTVLLLVDITRSIAATCAANPSRSFIESTEASWCTVKPVSFFKRIRSAVQSPYCRLMNTAPDKASSGASCAKSRLFCVPTLKLPLRQEIPMTGPRPNAW